MKWEDYAYIPAEEIILNISNASEGMSSYVSADILATEELLLKNLSFDLITPTTFDFVRLFVDCVPEIVATEIAGAGENFDMFVNCLAEASLLCPLSYTYPPSKVAASLCIYSLVLLGTDALVVPPTLTAMTGYGIKDISDALLDVRELHETLTMQSVDLFENVRRRHTLGPDLSVSAAFKPLDANFLNRYKRNTQTK